MIIFFTTKSFALVCFCKEFTRGLRHPISFLVLQSPILSLPKANLSFMRPYAVAPNLHQQTIQLSICESLALSVPSIHYCTQNLCHLILFTAALILKAEQILSRFPDPLFDSTFFLLNHFLSLLFAKVAISYRSFKA